ncbi:translocon-associated protein subunit gamma [Exaiptasia diaphana]|uniref:Translocon-associated protein subunit gamma n=1 Tax=Exaiptasia diaphana TaxID=2652724 RepID=A0A913XH69_EXADI|nr:translocon-associated protein subunit gamma [Exaiptasia diaphana]KXJ12102.1 Translocon-associated protein subunit gamma [Exaiptasia diaphana]
MAGGKKLTKEDELLLQNFSRNVSTKSNVLFYANALIVSAIPLWLFWRIHQMDPYSSGILFAVMTLVSTWLVAFAYKNVKFQLKHKIAQRRDGAITKEVSQELDPNKKMSRQEKDERILWKKNKVADMEAMTFSIFYNNALYLFLVLFASFYALRSFNPSANYLISTSAASGILALLSTGTSSS